MVPELWLGLSSPTNKNTQKHNKTRCFWLEIITAMSLLSTVLQWLQNTSRFSCLTRAWRQVVKWYDYPPVSNVETEGTEIAPSTPQIFIKHLLHVKHYEADSATWPIPSWFRNTWMIKCAKRVQQRALACVCLFAQASTWWIRAMSQVMHQLIKIPDKEVVRGDTQAHP